MLDFYPYCVSLIWEYLTRNPSHSVTMFCSKQRVFATVGTAHLEELRRQQAHRALERECSTLRRNFSSLEKEHRVLRTEHEFQAQRLDSLVVQSGSLLALIGCGLDAIDEPSVDADDGSDRSGYCARSDMYPSFAVTALQAENVELLSSSAGLLRRNADLELQNAALVAQFGHLLAEYEDVRAKHSGLKGAVAAATSIEELGGWVEL
jgi:hypothetical protein